MERDHEHDEITLDLSPDTMQRAEQGDLSVITEIEEQIKSQYHPLPSIPGLKIVP
jgi:hypothetical protein